LTPLGQGGGAVLLEDAAAVEAAVLIRMIVYRAEERQRNVDVEPVPEGKRDFGETGNLNVAKIGVIVGVAVSLHIGNAQCGEGDDDENNANHAKNPIDHAKLFWLLMRHDFRVL
jgi:hypothetical protein